MTKAKISRGEAVLRAELARIGVNVSGRNVQEAVSFAVELIDKRVNTPSDWRRRLRRLAAHAIAVRIPSVIEKDGAKNEHRTEIGTHMAWLAKRGVSGDELKELSLGIADRMTGE